VYQLNRARQPTEQQSKTRWDDGATDRTAINYHVGR